mmetsp:Transcript_58082/g.126158  ORF Transcript_58082/g.126158 Transcript_58082/m.126158 type:complete len:98 (+) Transcript_58082:1548-1841(+)|eukprot:1128004-Pleurochrysis_carterae.AAC.2
MHARGGSEAVERSKLEVRQEELQPSADDTGGSETEEEHGSNMALPALVEWVRLLWQRAEGTARAALVSGRPALAALSPSRPWVGEMQAEWFMSKEFS